MDDERSSYYKVYGYLSKNCSKFMKILKKFSGSIEKFSQILANF